MNKKNIFWDMDNTLGEFEYISKEMDEKNYIGRGTKLGLRRGIESLLTELSDKGYVHYITSAAVKKYVFEVLKRTGIREYFDKIYCREDIGGRYSPKDYTSILKEMKISPDNIGRDVLIVGDKETDVPSRINRIVTILDLVHFARDASLTKMMIEMLENNGGGDFNKGFYKLYSESEKIPSEYVFLKKSAKIILKPETELHLKFMETRENCSGAPVFEVYRADNYFSYNIL